MAAEVASERLGVRGMDAGSTRSARVLHVLGMACAEPCASFQYGIENAAAVFFLYLHSVYGIANGLQIPLWRALERQLWARPDSQLLSPDLFWVSFG